MAITYGNKVVYKKIMDGKEMSMQATEIRSMTTPYNQLENIQIGKKEKLMILIVDGKTKLFHHIVMSGGAKQPGSGGSYLSHGELNRTFVIGH